MIYNMQTPQKQIDNNTPNDTELTIEKALEFAGDNSSYQKKRLIILSTVILSLAVLNCKIPFLNSSEALLFLVASGAGQILCPIYFDLANNSLGVAGFALLCMISYPFSEFVTGFAYCGLGFFSRGFFASSLIYLNQIGGDRFRAWSIIVIFAVWGLSSLLSSLQKMVNLPLWIWYYALIFIPALVGSYYVLKLWRPSPYSLYTKGLFNLAKEVLNQMAEENNRAHLPYGLQGEKQSENLLNYKRPTYFDIIHRPFLLKITIPLVVLWIYKEYVYFGSFLLMPQLSEEYSKNYILVSISQTVAVLMSYPIRLKIKRVNTLFSLTVLIAICSILSSFTTLSAECMEAGFVCGSKYIYRVSIMIIRFSIALMGNLLISYTMQVYPINYRNMGFAICLAMSSVGSILFPWINLVLIYMGMSGFLFFAVASVVTLYFTIQLNQTYGRMCNEKLQQLEKASPLIQLKNWPSPTF